MSFELIRNDFKIGAINRHKSGPTTIVPAQPTSKRNATYVNPNYKPPKPPSRQILTSHLSAVAGPSTKPASLAAREVVIDGVAFQSLGRSLVRKEGA